MTSRDQAVLAASLAASRLLATSMDTASVEELAQAAGISRRTWFRYFPTKEDCIRPMLRESSSMTVHIIDSRLEHEPLCDAFVTAFQAVAGGLFAERTRKLLPVMSASPAWSAVLDSEAVHTASLLRELMERRLAPQADHDAIAAVTTILPALANAALRDSLVEHVPAVQLLARRVEALRLPHLSLSQ